MSTRSYFKTFFRTLAICSLSLFAASSIAFAGPGNGDGQEPWPLASGNLSTFKRSEIIGFWGVEGTSWLLSIKAVKNESKTLVVQIWNEFTADTVFNGPLRIKPLWVEGVGVMSSQEICSIYLFRASNGFKMKMSCGFHVEEYNLHRMRLQ